MRSSTTLSTLAMAVWLLSPGGPGGHARATASGNICEAAAKQAESALRIPDAFLSAIARVESGRSESGSGNLVAWPWTIDVGGTGTFFASKAEAMAAVRALQARGVSSIDVGCLQVNLAQHPEAFATLDQAFDPDANARFAAGFLTSLFAQTGSWPLAAAAYHSQTPALGSAYQRRVLAEWAVPEGPTANSSPRSVKAEPARPASADPVPSADEHAGAGPAFGREQASVPRTMSGLAATGVSWPTTGRGLSAYRSMPTRLAFTPPSIQPLDQVRPRLRQGAPGLLERPRG